MGIRTGGTFGDYAVVRLLGKGGMGEVWLLEGKTGRQVAAKILEAEADHEARKRFLREAQLALGVKHPNLVEVYDVGEDPETGLCYILMEYVSGGTLAECLKERGKLSIEDAIAVVQAIAGVLELARQKGIVHRDIKPANIMFAADGTPKLADLGVARSGGGVETTTVTQTGTMIGTPAYMAPEQMLDAHNVDTRADIYSLGVVFFEMLTGERPNKDDTVVQLMAKAMKGEPLPDVRTLRPEVSASLAQLLNMMVAPDRDGRIATPGQITNALALIERGGEFAGRRVPTSRRSVARPRAMPVERRSRFPLRPLVPVALLAVLATAFFFLAPQKERPSSPAAKTEIREQVRMNFVELTNVVEFVVERTNTVERAVERTNTAEKVVLTENAVSVESATVASVSAEKGAERGGRRVDAAKLKDDDPTRAVQKTLDALFPGWKTSEVGNSGRLGYWEERDGERDILCTHPPRRGEPVVLSRSHLVEGRTPVLHVRLANNEPGAQFRLRIRVDGRIVREKDVTSGWTDVYVDLRRWRGKKVKLALEHQPTGWWAEWAFWSVIEVVDNVAFAGAASAQSVETPVRIFDRAKVVGSRPEKAAQRTCDVLFPGWRISPCGHPDAAGYEEEYRGRYNLLFTHPPREDKPVVISRRLTLPRKSPKLYVSVIGGEDFELQVKVNGKVIERPDVTGREWTDLTVDLSRWAGRNVLIELLNMPTGWRNEEDHWQRIEVK